MRFSASSRYLRAAAGEAHALLEDLQRLLERQVARLELVHDLLEALRAPSSNVMSVISLPDRAPRGRSSAPSCSRISMASPRRTCAARAHDLARRAAASGCSLGRARPAATGSRAGRPTSSKRCRDAFIAVPGRRREPATELREQRRAAGNPSHAGCSERKAFVASATRCAAWRWRRAHAPRGRGGAASSSRRRCRSRSGAGGIGEHAPPERAQSARSRRARRRPRIACSRRSVERPPARGPRCSFSRTTSSAARRRRGRAQVGHEVGDGEVGLVARPPR